MEFLVLAELLRMVEFFALIGSRFRDEAEYVRLPHSEDRKLLFRNPYLKKKMIFGNCLCGGDSRIRETLNLSACAECSTNKFNFYLIY